MTIVIRKENIMELKTFKNFKKLYEENIFNSFDINDLSYTSDEEFIFEGFESNEIEFSFDQDYLFNQIIEDHINLPSNIIVIDHFDNDNIFQFDDY